MAANPSNPPRHFYSLDEYFALENAGDARFEYWDGELFCMSGASFAHVQISGNIFHALRSKLAGGPCLVLNGDLAIKTPSPPPYKYPDVSVTCVEARIENIRGIDALLNPVVIVEVLSPTTEGRDGVEKFAAYQQIPGFLEYLLVAQESALITHCGRGPDGLWALRDISGMDGTVQLVSKNAN
ncbi:MAG TPA: Uma2 family endonuclease [Blastocatellia bacterium]|nr:Uma2 family endonuclease [Blastocatellia bacterium]